MPRWRNWRRACRPDAQPGVVYRHPALPMAHALLKVDVGVGTDQNASAAAMLAAYHQARADLGLVPGADGLLPSFRHAGGQRLAAVGAAQPRAL